jgi:hypothetical protein
MFSLESFNQKNGLLGIDRDCYLSLIQYISTRDLRSYVGLSEKSFEWCQHYFYHVYRNKYNKIPIEKLVLYAPNPYRIFGGRTVVSTDPGIIITLKEFVFESIFEIKLKCHCQLIRIRSNIVVTLDDEGEKYIYKILTKSIRYLFDLQDKCMLYFDPKLFLEKGVINITIILDMISRELYLKVDGVPIRHAICNIPHKKKRVNIWVYNGTSITLISLTHLKCVPINLSEKYIYHDSITGEIVNKND